MDNPPPIDQTNLDVLIDQAYEISILMNTTLTKSWKSMIHSYAHEHYPEKQSEEFNLQDPYWLLMFARTALQHAKQDTIHESDIPAPLDDDNKSVLSSNLNNKDTTRTDLSEAVQRGSITNSKVLKLTTLPTEQNVNQIIKNNKSLDYLSYKKVTAEQDDLNTKDPSPKFLLHVIEEILSTY